MNLAPSFGPAVAAVLDADQTNQVRDQERRVLTRFDAYPFDLVALDARIRLESHDPNRVYFLDCALPSTLRVPAHLPECPNLILLDVEQQLAFLAARTTEGHPAVLDCCVCERVIDCANDEWFQLQCDDAEAVNEWTLCAACFAHEQTREPVQALERAARRMTRFGLSALGPGSQLDWVPLYQLNVQIARAQAESPCVDCGLLELCGNPANPHFMRLALRHDPYGCRLTLLRENTALEDVLGAVVDFCANPNLAIALEHHLNTCFQYKVHLLYACFMTPRTVSAVFVHRTMQVFDEAVSIGPLCTSAWRARAANVRRAGYPFDWCFTSLDVVQRVVDASSAQAEAGPEAEAEAEAELWLSILRAPLSECRSTYFKAPAELTFNHDARPQDAVLSDAAIARLERAASRWCALLRSPSRKPLFVWGGVRATLQHLPALERLHAALRARLPECGVLAITCEQALPGEEVRVVSCQIDCARGWLHAHVRTPYFDYNWRMDAEESVWAPLLRTFVRPAQADAAAEADADEAILD